MSYQVRTIDNFEREAKRLKKKFHSLKDEISQLIDALEANPFLGTPLQDGFYKIQVRHQIEGERQTGRSQGHYLR
ncbi:hypothetical protein [Spirosoma luteum]|uniref:hypothetical protein n=1 Tax=Spirosoma luteum TaxID=431553 RepID=UPI0003A8E203